MDDVYLGTVSFKDWYKSYWKEYPDEENSSTYRHQLNAFNCVKALAHNKIRSLQSDNKKLKDALMFYADHENWEDCWVDGCPAKEDYFTAIKDSDCKLPSIKDDMGSRVGGYRARQTLKALCEAI